MILICESSDVIVPEDLLSQVHTCEISRISTSRRNLNNNGKDKGTPINSWRAHVCMCVCVCGGGGGRGYGDGRMGGWGRWGREKECLPYSVLCLSTDLLLQFSLFYTRKKACTIFCQEMVKYMLLLLLLLSHLIASLAVLCIFLCYLIFLCL